MLDMIGEAPICVREYQEKKKNGYAPKIRTDQDSGQDLISESR